VVSRFQARTPPGPVRTGGVFACLSVQLTTIHVSLVRARLRGTTSGALMLGFRRADGGARRWGSPAWSGVLARLFSRSP
jgi:hypothetical protein